MCVKETGRAREIIFHLCFMMRIIALLNAVSKNVTDHCELSSTLYMYRLLRILSSPPLLFSSSLKSSASFAPSASCLPVNIHCVTTPVLLHPFFSTRLSLSLRPSASVLSWNDGQKWQPAGHPYLNFVCVCLSPV